MIVEVTTTIEKTVNAKTLYVRAGVRYWDDAKVNGDNPEDGSHVPFKSGDDWKPVIDVDSGIVLGWPEGSEANIHFKVCDDFSCYLNDDTDAHIISFEGYVPEFMSPKDCGYGDYIIMSIDGLGKIGGWRFDFEQIKGNDSE